MQKKLQLATIVASAYTSMILSAKRRSWRHIEYGLDLASQRFFKLRLNLAMGPFECFRRPQLPAVEEKRFKRTHYTAFEMRHILSTLLLGVLLFMAPACFQGPPGLPEYSKEIAKVGDTLIKEDALRLELQFKISNLPDEIKKSALKGPLYASDDFRPLLLQTLDQMIQDELVLQYGQENDLLLNDADLAQKLQKESEKFSGRELEIFLKERDLSLGAWNRHLEREIQTNHVLYEALKDQLAISAQDIKNYYTKNRSEFETPERVRVRQIVTDSEDKARELLARIQKGENFAKLALEHSQSPDRIQGGDLGFIGKGEFPKVFDACFQLQKGELSGVLKSDYGYHIFKILDKRPAEIPPLEDVSQKIFQKLFAEKQKIQYQKWLDEQKRTITIEVFDDNLKTLTL